MRKENFMHKEIQIPKSVEKRKSTVSMSTAQKNLLMALKNVIDPKSKNVSTFIDNKLVKPYFDSLDAETQNKVVMQTNAMNRLAESKIIKN